MAANISLLVMAIVFLVLVLGFAIWDIVAPALGNQSISGRIQSFIRNNPALSVLLYAAFGFIAGLTFHFEVQSWNYYVVEITATVVGTVLGVIVWRLRKPGMPL